MAQAMAVPCMGSELLQIYGDHASEPRTASGTDSLAEWSKALAPGASPQGRGFEPHSCHSLAFNQIAGCIIIAHNPCSLRPMCKKGV